MIDTPEIISATYDSTLEDLDQKKEKKRQNICSFFSPNELGFIFTFSWFFLWLVIIPLALYQANNGVFEFKNIALNTVGDYLAGIAAPIAFLWLVLGYRQQGKELSNSNKMLRLQHKELQNSVKAQNDQADSMKKQLDILVREKFYPRFKLESIDYSAATDYMEVKIENIGNAVGSINIILDSDEMALIDFDTVEKLTTIQIQTMSDMGISFTIKLQINSTLETGMTIADCFKIDYNVLRHNHSLGIFPPLERIQCIGQA